MDGPQGPNVAATLFFCFCAVGFGGFLLETGFARAALGVVRTRYPQYHRYRVAIGDGNGDFFAVGGFVGKHVQRTRLHALPTFGGFDFRRTQYLPYFFGFDVVTAHLARRGIGVFDFSVGQAFVGGDVVDGFGRLARTARTACRHNGQKNPCYRHSLHIFFSFKVYWARCYVFAKFANFFQKIVTTDIFYHAKIVFHIGDGGRVRSSS